MNSTASRAGRILERAITDTLAQRKQRLEFSRQCLTLGTLENSEQGAAGSGLGRGKNAPMPPSRLRCAVGKVGLIPRTALEPHGAGGVAAAAPGGSSFLILITPRGVGLALPQPVGRRVVKPHRAVGVRRAGASQSDSPAGPESRCCRRVAAPPRRCGWIVSRIGFAGRCCLRELPTQNGVRSCIVHYVPFAFRLYFRGPRWSHTGPEASPLPSISDQQSAVSGQHGVGPALP